MLLLVLDNFIKPVKAQPAPSANQAYSPILSFTASSAIDIPLSIVNLAADPSYTSVTLSWNTVPDTKPADSRVVVAV